MAKGFGRRRRPDRGKENERQMKARQKAIEDYEREKALRKQIELLGLGNFAEGLVEKYELYANRRGKVILKLLLQRMLLGMPKEGKPKMTKAERACFDLVDRAWLIQKILLESKYGRVSLEKAQRLYQVIGEVMDAAEPLLKQKPKFSSFDFRKAAKKARRNLQEITEKEVQVVLINRERLLETVEIGEEAIEELVKSLPEIKQAGFAVIEEIVNAKLGKVS